MNDEIRRLGSADPNTFGDSFSGDDTLDALFCALWPISWPAYIAARLASKVAARFVD
jgi:hypothetical protein